MRRRRQLPFVKILVIFFLALSLSLLSIGSRNHLLSTNGKREREGGENELITEQVK
jgi:hypothetical protein